MKKEFRRLARAWATEYPVGDPLRGAPYGERNDAVTSLISGMGSSSAAGQEASAGNQAISTLSGGLNTATQAMQPYTSLGSQAAGQLSSQLSSLTQPINNTNWQQYMSPAYNFQLQQGQQALQNSQAAQSGVLSGAALKGMQDYTQNTANTAFQSAFNDYQTQNNNIYSMLSNTANMGMTGTTNLNNLGYNYNNAIGNAMEGVGNANAAGTQGFYNGIGGAISTGAGLLSSLI